jgi:hypothetical protein
VKGDGTTAKKPWQADIVKNFTSVAKWGQRRGGKDAKAGLASSGGRSGRVPGPRCAWARCAGAFNRLLKEAGKVQVGLIKLD